ncbi:hypothetical protein M422DRAFT_210008 [Sphaerobolus stellatus SS14]|uniref:DUF1989 domain-containing protein n=1 Tax=Sphaerobolus stellatus (strain SS14) TaxID=990650 RepID=A0A0C9VFE8_SPHS4|nr:hypothetical protein M422DRAFT_210008 [Sphaerobolus stellatus SS14]
MSSTAALLEAAYSPIPINKAFYDKVANTEGRKLTESFILPIRSGKAWKVNAAQVFRISTPEGPQVGDLNLWNANDPRERFWASRTRQLQAAHVTTYDRLWSTLPFLRPMTTIVYDSMDKYGVDHDGGRVHDLLGTRCDPYINKYLTGVDRDFHCHSNLVRAVKPFGLSEFDVHDVLNVFQCTGLNNEDKYFMKTCPAIKDTYIEFFAEQDLIVALSTCPGGDLSIRMWGSDDSSKGDVDDDPALACCRPLKVEVFDISEEVVKDWKPWDIPKYGGKHGLENE